MTVGANLLLYFLVFDRLRTLVTVEAHILSSLIVFYKGWFPYDRRRSRIADRRKFSDRLRSYGNTLLRSPAILRS